MCMQLPMSYDYYMHVYVIFKLMLLDNRILYSSPLITSRGRSS